jgi:hypothetical protein
VVAATVLVYLSLWQRGRGSLGTFS